MGLGLQTALSNPPIPPVWTEIGLSGSQTLGLFIYRKLASVTPATTISWPCPHKKSRHFLDSLGIYFVRGAREAYRVLGWQTHRYTSRLSPVYMLHHVRRAQGNPHCRKKCNHRLTPPLPASFWKRCFAPSRRITTSAFGRCPQSAASQSSKHTSAGPSRT